MEEKEILKASIVRGSRASRLWSTVTCVWRAFAPSSPPAQKTRGGNLGAHGAGNTAPRSRIGFAARRRQNILLNSARFTSRVSPACVNSELRARRAKIKPTLTACVALFIAACFAACAPQSATNTNGSGFSVSTTSAASPEAALPDRAPRLAPRSLEIKLTIASVADLRVRQGQHVNAGAVLSDRAADRARLTAQRAQITLSLKKILEVHHFEIPQLPPASFAEQLAGIRRADVLLTDAQQKRAVQRARINALDKLPALPAAVKLHEQATLAQFERNVTAAEAELNLAKGKLETAKQDRARLDQTNALEISRQNVGESERSQQVAIERSQLEASLRDLDNQLARLATVRAPFSGRIKRVSWEGQQNAEITMLVLIAVDDVDDGRAAAEHVNESR